MPYNMKVNCTYESHGDCLRKPMKRFLWFSWRPTCVDYKCPPTFPHTDCPDADPIPRPTHITPPPPPPYGYQPNRSLDISNPPGRIMSVRKNPLMSNLEEKPKLTKLKYIFGEQND